VVSYDVANDRRRNRVCKELKNHGDHIQYSVFECLLDDLRLQQLEKKLAVLVDPDKDSVRIYLLCGNCRARVKILGAGSVAEEPDVFVV